MAMMIPSKLHHRSRKDALPTSNQGNSEDKSNLILWMLLSAICDKSAFRLCYTNTLLLCKANLRGRQAKDLHCLAAISEVLTIRFELYFSLRNLKNLGRISIMSDFHAHLRVVKRWVFDHWCTNRQFSMHSIRWSSFRMNDWWIANDEQPSSLRTLVLPGAWTLSWCFFEFLAAIVCSSFCFKTLSAVASDSSKRSRKSLLTRDSFSIYLQ